MYNSLAWTALPHETAQSWTGYFKHSGDGDHGIGHDLKPGSDVGG
jgi:hypothetical protein